MIVSSNTKREGICFALLPKKTPQGTVWLEWVHYRWVDSWGWGSSGYWEYARWVSNAEYDQGKRRQYAGDPAETWDQEQARLHKNPPDHYATPPHKNLCRNYQLRQPGCAVACWYPHCTCMNVGGSKCPD